MVKIYAINRTIYLRLVIELISYRTHHFSDKNKINMKMSEGSISIIIIVLVLITLSICAAFLELAKRNLTEQQVRYASSHAANAASYTYASTFVREWRSCIVREIQDRIDDQDPKMLVCQNQGIEQCLETGLVGCQVELSNCWQEDNSPISQCTVDSSVRQTADDQARVAAHHIARKYHVQIVDDIDIKDSIVELNVKKTYTSSGKKFPMKKEVVRKGKSKMIVRPK